MQQKAAHEQECKLMDEEVLGFLEDLRETISDYQVRSFIALAPFSTLTGTPDGAPNEDLRTRMQSNSECSLFAFEQVK